MSEISRPGQCLDAQFRAPNPAAVFPAGRFAEGVSTSAYNWRGGVGGPLRVRAIIAHEPEVLLPESLCKGTHAPQPGTTTTEGMARS